MDDTPERLDTNSIVQDPSVCPSDLFFTDADRQRLANAAEAEPAFHDAVQDETETFPQPLDGENYTSDKNDIEGLLDPDYGKCPECGEGGCHYTL